MIQLLLTLSDSVYFVIADTLYIRKELYKTIYLALK